MSDSSTKSRRVPRKLLGVVAIAAGASFAACGGDEAVQGVLPADASPDGAQDAGSDVLIGINVNDSGADVTQGTTIHDASSDGDTGTDA